MAVNLYRQLLDHHWWCILHSFRWNV